MPIDLETPDNANPEVRMSSRTFERLAQYITSELGIKMPASKVSMIQSRLLHRVRILGLHSIDEYCDRFFASEENHDERVYFINAVTTNKTDFFREPQHFTFLTERALPRLTASHSLDTINVWSAACSSGQEPYTLAMVLREYAAAHPPFAFRILATDISTKVLAIAQEGIYTRQQIEPVPEALRRKYLLRSKSDSGSLTRVAPVLRQFVSFHPLNLMDAAYPVREQFHVVFCRNVLIYFDRATQESVIGKLCRHLIPGGYLFVSHSESLSGLNLPLVSLGGSCFQRIGSYEP